MNRELHALLAEFVADCRSAYGTPRSPYRVAVIGSGPAGLAAAVELNRLGVTVQVFEAAPVCGITMLRRPAQESSSAAPTSFEPAEESALEAAVAELTRGGIAFSTSSPQGMAELHGLRSQYDAVVCACGKAAVLPADGAGRVHDGLYAAGTCVKNQKVQDALQAAASGRNTARTVQAFLTGQTS